MYNIATKIKTSASSYKTGTQLHYAQLLNPGIILISDFVYETLLLRLRTRVLKLM
jgi:hypothetical protein